MPFSALAALVQLLLVLAVVAAVLACAAAEPPPQEQSALQPAGVPAARARAGLERRERDGGMGQQRGETGERWGSDGRETPRQSGAERTRPPDFVG